MLIENLPTVSILIPHLGREEGLARCKAAVEALDYPKNLIEVLVDDRAEPTVPEKVRDMAAKATGEWLCFLANDTQIEEYALRLAILHAKREDKKFCSFDSGRPDENEHFIIHRELVGKLQKGQIFDLDFIHCCCDNFLVAQVKKIGEYSRCDDAKVTHHHFSRGAPMDEVYERGWKGVELDRAVLAKKLESL